MNSRRFPRSMSEAFGPYTDRELHPMPEPRNCWGGVWLASAIGIVLAALLFADVLGAF